MAAFFYCGCISTILWLRILKFKIVVHMAKNLTAPTHFGPFASNWGVRLKHQKTVFKKRVFDIIYSYIIFPRFSNVEKQPLRNGGSRTWKGGVLKNRDFLRQFVFFVFWSVVSLWRNHNFNIVKWIQKCTHSVSFGI